MILGWTNWTFWLIALALVAFGFCLRDIYEQSGHWTLRLAKRKDGRQDAGYNLEDKWREYLEAWHLLER
jgi:hypothetical protein